MGPAQTDLALQVQFKITQWWSPERLLAHQMRQIQTLIDHAYMTVPFYGDRLTGLAGLPPGELTLQAFRALPMLTRSDIQNAGREIVTTNLPEHHGPISNIVTSGSMGRPLKTKGTSVTGLFFRALALRYHLWHRRDFAGKLVAIGITKNKKREQRYRNWSAGITTGPLIVLDQTLPVRHLLNRLIEEDPHYIQVLPSTLTELLRLSMDEGTKPKSLRQVLSVSEPLDDTLRRRCEQVWGITMADLYSSMENNAIAFQCPDNENMHVQAENCLVEVLNDDGRPSQPGQIGRIVITALNNFAAPMIRYENGDYAEVGTPCNCGRGLPVLNRIAGRYRNLVVLPSGEKITPALMSQAVLTDLPINQFQLVQKSLDEIEARLVVGRPLNDAEEKRFAKEFADGLGHDFDFKFTYLDEIPRLASGKYEVFRCEI